MCNREKDYIIKLFIVEKNYNLAVEKEMCMPKIIRRRKKTGMYH